MFERFTTQARDVVVACQGHARRLGHPRIGTSHLLLALVEKPSPTSDLLREAGITLAGAEHTLADLLATAGGTTSGPAGPAAPAEAPGARDDAEALAALGIDLDRIRAAMDAAFGPGALERAAPTGRRTRRFGLSRRLPSYDSRAERAALTSGERAPTGHLAFTPDARKALELALREALRLGDGYIGAEHLLLGLVRGDCLAAQLLVRSGVDPVALREAVEQRRRRSA